MMEIYAHTKEGESEHSWQTLSSHLRGVSELAGRFADEFGCGPWGRAAGTLHDAGKVTEAFQRRLRGSAERVVHSTAGALIAKSYYGESCGTLLAYMVAGHHGGLPNAIAHGVCTPLRERLAKQPEPNERFFKMLHSGDISLPEQEELVRCFGRERSYGSEGTQQECKVFSVYLLSKMLYSCLVDADYLDTEGFSAPDLVQARERKRPNLAELYTQLEQYMQQLQQGKEDILSTVNQVRASIYQDSIAAADANPGLFTLTVPTGGGKTLSSLAFALKHAMRNGKKRVIYAIPFTTIVEQTASVFKGIFGEDVVLEHHSSFDFDGLDEEDQTKHRLAVQNWDAPIVVTTNVQFLESLYANNPSRCRKVHNVANSVVIFDEAQKLPDSLLEPSLAALEELSLGYGTSVVFCTATQPALNNRWPFGSMPREIVRDRRQFDEAFGKRVCYEMLGDLDEDDLVTRISGESQALCIVGTRGEARILYDAIRERQRSGKLSNGDGSEEECCVFHLSAAMTPEHRSGVLDTIQRRLDADSPCLVISTQLIEAGVDVDFPVVYREMAGLDSIVQAGGRCNREGKRAVGTVRVFDYCIEGKKQTTSPWLEKMKGIGRDTLVEFGELNDRAVEQFFETRYRNHDTDSAGIFAELKNPSMVASFAQYEFERYARDFRLIDEQGEPVFVPRGKSGSELLKLLETTEFPGSLASKLQCYTVTVPAWSLEDYVKSGSIYEVGPFHVLRIDDPFREFYREDVGLLVPGEEGMKEFIL